MNYSTPIHIQPGTRLLRLERCSIDCYWILWLHTNDFKHGTYLRMYDCGKVERVTEREGEGVEVLLIKP